MLCLAVLLFCLLDGSEHRKCFCRNSNYISYMRLICSRNSKRWLYIALSNIFSMLENEYTCKFRCFFEYGSNFGRLKINGKAPIKKESSNSSVNWLDISLPNNFKIFTRTLLQLTGFRGLRHKYFWSLVYQLALKKGIGVYIKKGFLQFFLENLIGAE